ncbi:Hypothetical predicted protein [Cloeon dipterum]|uniref:Uncharacterized protein n=1 Tax=Cloeon dipterum TaxID=197152 RepID=A0A8S1DR34_9INSE|nr:Hypothetical predicted protein [Cloeon dipterum]
MDDLRFARERQSKPILWEQLTSLKVLSVSEIYIGKNVGGFKADHTNRTPFLEESDTEILGLCDGRCGRMRRIPIPKQRDWSLVVLSRWGSPAMQLSQTEPKENLGRSFCLQVL